MKKQMIAIILLTHLSLAGCSAMTQPSDQPVQTHSSSNKETKQEKQGDEKSAVLEEEKGNTVPATVLSVTDGDTLKAELKNGATEKVRLILIDTPESRGKYEGNPQPFAKEASAFTKEQLEGKEIELELGVEERDRFGRLLAYIWMDGQMYNKRLLKEGLARVAVYPPNTKYLDQFKEAEAKAKKEERKIWSLENYATDRGFEDEVNDQVPEEPSKGENSQANQQFDPKGPDKDCGDFSGHEEAQAFFEAAGPGDPHRLDRDGDGLACDK
ncbi:thermonuclease family protein [Bacillus sp. SJS]|uniref:thermonuclease family protein n=1 Tax=Bacillus sp. SJS TaxID=1423321 RepID=UPI00068CED91|nr:thermonuclease family protein [Bacillus sp. SJS]